jgi:hypothetical protein
MRGVMMERNRDAELTEQVERVRRDTNLEEKLARYRERRESYEDRFRSSDKQAPSVPVQRESAEGRTKSRRGARGFAGDGLL